MKSCQTFLWYIPCLKHGFYSLSAEFLVGERRRLPYQGFGFPSLNPSFPQSRRLWLCCLFAWNVCEVRIKQISLTKRMIFFGFWLWLSGLLVSGLLFNWGFRKRFLGRGRQGWKIKCLLTKIWIMKQRFQRSSVHCAVPVCLILTSWEYIVWRSIKGTCSSQKEKKLTSFFARLEDKIYTKQRYYNPCQNGWNSSNVQLCYLVGETFHLRLQLVFLLCEIFSLK